MTPRSHHASPPAVLTRHPSTNLKPREAQALARPAHPRLDLERVAGFRRAAVGDVHVRAHARLVQARGGDGHPARPVAQGARHRAVQDPL